MDATFNERAGTLGGRSLDSSMAPGEATIATLVPRPKAGKLKLRNGAQARAK